MLPVFYTNTDNNKYFRFFKNKRFTITVTYLSREKKAFSLISQHCSFDSQHVMRGWYTLCFGAQHFVIAMFKDRLIMTKLVTDLM